MSAECLMEIIWEANHGSGESQVDAAVDLKQRLKATNPLGEAALTEISCDRCETTFSVGSEFEAATGSRAASVSVLEPGDGKKCKSEQPRGDVTKPGDFVLNIYLDTLQKVSGYRAQ
jgi:hypothetical protein